MGQGGRRRSGSTSSSSTPAQEQAQAALAAAAGGTTSLIVKTARPVASLWAGYGTITEVEADDEDAAVGGRQLLIVKEVQPPAGSGISHQRKLRSYQIEASFYERVAPLLPPGAACHLPRCLGVHSTLTLEAGSSGGGSGGMQLVMNDLRQQFPSSCGSLDEAHTKAALSWLAAFHAACWGADAGGLGLWPEACYWHLETRLEELQDIGREWRQLQAAAHELDRRLRRTPFRTLCHGDFKTANLLFSAGGSSSSSSGASGGGSGGAAGPACAAFDFQYVGGGSGMKDVVYLLASGVQARLLQQPAGEEALLRHYHQELIAGLRAAAAAAAASGSDDGGGSGGSGDGRISSTTGVGCPVVAAAAVQQYSFEAMMSDYRLAMCDYVRFMAGWGFWGNSSWASARARLFLTELGLAG